MEFVEKLSSKLPVEQFEQERCVEKRDENLERFKRKFASGLRSIGSLFLFPLP
jgi:hypothetical protein